MYRKRLVWLVLIVVFAAPAFAQPTAPAVFTVRFESTWSAATQPDDFPPNPHFSGLIGATHAASVTFWEAGGTASAGIETMAETGGKSPLRAEVEAAVQAGSAGTVLDGGGIAVSPGAVELTFEATPAHPFVTLVSMVAPSPDWFVGVAGLSLVENGAWVDRLEVELFVYDAGTDSGTTYTAPNLDTDPAEPIARIETAPFLVDGSVRSVGTFAFIRQTPTAVEGVPDAVPGTHALSAVYPNPFRTQAALTLSVHRRQHVRAALYDLRGRQVATLFEGSLAPGAPHRLTVDGAGLPAGVYLVAIDGEVFRDRRLVVRVR